MFKFLEKFALRALGSQREYTEIYLRQLWMRSSGHSLDEALERSQADSARVKVMFDALDDHFGAEIRSGDDRRSKVAGISAISSIAQSIDVFTYEAETRGIRL